MAISVGVSTEIKTSELVAYEWIKSRIRRGGVKPGTRLRAEEIAEVLGISRMPVREALRRLDSEGHVTLRPNCGATVTAYSEKEIVELFEIRAALEGLAAAGAASLVFEEQIEALSSLVGTMARAEAGHDNEMAVQCHWEFHRYIAKLSGRQKLEREVERLQGLLEPYLRIWLASGANLAGSAPEHEALVAAFQVRDPALAEAEMRRHIMSVAAVVAGLVSSVASGPR